MLPSKLYSQGRFQMNKKCILIHFKSAIHSYINNIWTYTKYQLITKGVFFLVVLPLFYKLADVLIKASGQMALSSGHFKEFLFSFRGLTLFAIGVLILLLVIIIDINALIEISASIKRSKTPIGVHTALWRGIKSIRNFLSPTGLFLIVYILLMVPLVGVGLRLSLIKNIQIPNFITSVIDANPMYSFIYWSVVVLFSIVGFFLLLTFHYMQIERNNAFSSMKNSIIAVWENKTSILKNFLLVNVFLFIITALLGISMQLFIDFIGSGIVHNVLLSRILMMFFLFTFAEFINLWFFLIAPLQIHLLTEKFFVISELSTQAFNQHASVTTPPAKARRGKIYFYWLICGLIVFNIFAGAFTGYYFDDIFRYRTKVDIVAHRGGGNLGPENTIAGLEAAIKAGARWSEIDVMRSKDGIYIINHDTTFERLTGSPKKPSEMTWNEIKKLKVKNHFNEKGKPDNVADLDGMLNAAKDKIGLLIELKGADADKKMADDVVNAIHAKNMEEETVIISLDYSLIEYIEKKHPEIKTGYLYFFALGDTAKLNTDYLIMEEAVVSLEAVEQIHSEGKKAFVWTVNYSDTVNKLIDANIDGIITDHVTDIKKSIKMWDQQSDVDIVLDGIKGMFEI